MTRLRGVLVALAVAATAAASGSALRAQDEERRAGLIVATGEGEAHRRCVTFDEESISGIDLLERSGLDIGIDRTSLGAAVCRIDGEGCGAGDCFCHYPTFWRYWTPDPEGAWRFSDVGAADREVGDGDLDGWSWAGDDDPPPPQTTFEDVCGDRDEATAPAATAGPGAPSSYLQLAGFAAALAAAAALLLAFRRRR